MLNIFECVIPKEVIPIILKVFFQLIGAIRSSKTDLCMWLF